MNWEVISVFLTIVGIVLTILGIWLALWIAGKLPKLGRFQINFPARRWCAWLQVRVHFVAGVVRTVRTGLSTKIGTRLIQFRGNMIVKIPNTIALSRTLQKNEVAPDVRVARCALSLSREFNPLDAERVSDHFGSVFTTQQALNAFNAAVGGRPNSEELLDTIRAKLAVLVANGEGVVDQHKVKLPWKGPLEDIFRTATEDNEA